MAKKKKREFINLQPDYVGMTKFALAVIEDKTQNEKAKAGMREYILDIARYANACAKAGEK